jgi:hypothetical protein
LLEVMVALVLTAVAVTIAGGALRAATIAGDGVARHRETLERSARLRSMLTDMLRHAPASDAVGEPLMSVSSASDGSARLVFLSRGVRAPFGSGAIWRVSLSAGDSGLVMDAVPIGASRDLSHLHSVISNVRALRVAFLERTVQMAGAQGTAAVRWREDWPLTNVRPAMIALSFLGHDVVAQGPTMAEPPLVVSLDPFTPASLTR